MPGSSRKAPVWLPILVLLIAMSSIQSGASLAKSLFPLVGAPGVTALRLALGTLILIAFFKPWRLRFAKETTPAAAVLWSVSGRDELSLLPVNPDRPAGNCRSAGIHRPARGSAVFIPTSGGFHLGCTGCTRALVPAAVRSGRFSRGFNRRCTGAGRWRLLGNLYSYRAACRRGTWSGDRRGRVINCGADFCTHRCAPGWGCLVALVHSTVRPGHCGPLHCASLLAGDDCVDAAANTHFWYSDEYGNPHWLRFQE